MATNLPPVNDRDVVRCDLCLLVQFRAANDICRRCRRSLDEEPEEPEPVPSMLAVTVSSHVARGGCPDLAATIRSLRLRGGLSQRELAGRLRTPRTYVSKIENEKATPTLANLERLARALEVSVPELLSGGERSRQEEIGELARDQFIAEILPFLPRLNPMQMSSVLAAVRQMNLKNLRGQRVN